MATDTIKECTISYPLCYYHCKQIHPFSQISSENPLSPIDGNNHRDWNCAENKRLSPQLHKDFFFYPISLSWKDQGSSCKRSCKSHRLWMSTVKHYFLDHMEDYCMCELTNTVAVSTILAQRSKKSEW